MAALGKPEYKQDGTLTFQYFLDSSKIVAECVIKHSKDKKDEFTKERRQLIKDGKDNEFNKLLLRQATFEQMTDEIVRSTVYSSVKIPK